MIDRNSDYAGGEGNRKADGSPENIRNSSEEGYCHIKLNNSCNCNCDFCADPVSVRREKGLGFPEVKFMLEGGRRKGFHRLIITGGEPTISSILFDTIRYAHGIGFDFIHLVTNGRMLCSETYLEKLISLGVDRYQVSYFAPDPELFDRISGVRGSFRQVYQGLVLLNKHSCDIMFNSVVTKENMSLLPELFIQMLSFRPSGIQFCFINPSGNSRVNASTVVPRYTETIPYLEKVSALADYFSFHDLHIENFPFCVLDDDLLKMVSDRNYPKSEKMLHSQGKRKDLARCASCSQKENCSGIWDNYIRIFGEEL